jgi:hypothetical protein
MKEPTLFSERAGRPRQSSFPNHAALVLLVVLLVLKVVAAQDSDSLYGTHGVNPQAVRQGTLGSCYFHASIASLAKTAPGTLRSSISQSSDGGYRVRFFDGPEEAVYPQDVQFGRTHGYDRSDGEWVLVLMRGYAQRTLRATLVDTVEHTSLIPIFARPVVLSWLDRSGPLLVAYDRAIRSVVGQNGYMDKTALQKGLAGQLGALGIPAAEAQMLGGFLDDQGFFAALAHTVQQNGEVFGAYAGMGQGGIPERVMRAILGSGGTDAVANRGPLAEQLRRLHAGRAVVVAGTYSTSENKGYDHTGWWVPNHAFSVLDYDEGSQTVRMRNPWGTHPDPDGSFTLPIAVFVHAYEFYSYSESPAQNAGVRSGPAVESRASEATQ